MVSDVGGGESVNIEDSSKMTSWLIRIFFVSGHHSLKPLTPSLYPRKLHFIALGSTSRYQLVHTPGNQKSSSSCNRPVIRSRLLQESSYQERQKEID